MKLGFDTRTLILISLVLFNLIIPGIILPHATPTINAASSASAKSADTAQLSHSLSSRDLTAGRATLEATVDVCTLPQVKGRTGSDSGPAPLESSGKYLAPDPSGTKSSPLIPSPSSTGPSSVTLLTGFEGMNQGQVGAGNPPDVILAAGPNNVVEMINGIGEVFTKQGVLVRSFTLNSFFQPGFASDPKVMYDASSQRWFASGIQTISASKVVLAVSASNDPNGIWNDYTLNGAGTCTDQPLLGVSDDKIVVTGNEFSNGCPATINTMGYLGAEFWVVNKLELLAGLKNIDITIIGPVPTTESAYPVQSLSSTTSEYLVSAGLNATFDSGATNPTSKALQLFTITGVPPDNVTITARIFPTLITRPPAGAEPGNGSLQTDDARVQDAVWYQGDLWLTLPDACNPTGDSQQRSCVHLIQIDTSLLKVKQDFEYGKNGQYFFYPAIALDNLGDLGLVYGYSSATNSTCCFPSVAVAGGLVTDPPNTLSPPRTTRQGTAAGGAQRYGDYFGAARDPTDPTIIWTDGEYLPSYNYGTFIESIRLTGLTLSATPSYLSIPAGFTGTSTLTITSVGGFAGNITVTSSISPSGPTVSLNPSSLALSSQGTQQSTITVSTISSTPAGLYNLTITASSTGGSRFLNIQVRVGPDFSISANPSSVSFPAGSSAATTVTVMSLNSFTGPVSLTVTISAPGPTGTFNTTTVNLTAGGTGSSRLTISTNMVVASGNYAVTVNATSGTITHYQILTVGVGDFGVSALPISLNLAAGSSTTFNITLVSINGFSGQVQLSATNSPSGPSLSFNTAIVGLPSQGFGNSTLTVSVPSFATTGSTYIITITGANGGLSHSAIVSVTVVGVVCIADVASILPCPGFSGWSFNGPFTSSPTQLKVGVFVSNSLGIDFFGVTVIADDTKLVPVSVETSAGVLGPQGQYFVCLRDIGGACGTVDNPNTVTVNGFNIHGPTSTPITGLLFSITYNITSITPTIPLTFASGCGTSVQGSSYCVFLSSGGNTVPVVVQTASFSSTPPQQSVSLSANPSSLGPIPANTGATTTITATSQNGFPVSSSDTGTVSFSVVTSPGVGTMMNSSVVTLASGGSSAVTLTLTGPGPGTFWATLYGTYTVTNATTNLTNTLIATVTVSITVTDIKLTANPATVSYDAGLTNTTKITVTSLNGFTGTVTLSFTVLFSNAVTVTFNPATVSLTAGGNATATATFRATKAGTFAVNLIGQNSNDVRFVRVTAEVYDFTVSESPSSQIIPAGSERQTVITVSSVGAFRGTVGLLAAPVSKAVSCWFTTLTNASSVTLPAGGSGNEYLTCTGSTAGAYTVTITGTIGTQSHSIVLNVTIQDFTLTGPGSVFFPTGSSNTGNLTLTSILGLSGTINLTITTPAAVSVSCPSSVNLLANVTAVASCSFRSSTPGRYTVTITGSFKCTDCYYNGILSRATQITVNTGDFSISISPSSASFKKGSGVSTTVTITSLYSFSGTVTLAAGLSPSTSNPPSVSLSSTRATVGPNGSVTVILTVLSTSNTTKGTYTITVTGISGSIGHTATFTVTIT